jgi:hypothetical protein
MKHVQNSHLLRVFVKQVHIQHHQLLVHQEYVMKHLIHSQLMLNVKLIKRIVKLQEEVVFTLHLVMISKHQQYVLPRLDVYGLINAELVQLHVFL